MSCAKCNDTGWYKYDSNHGKKCEVCCAHPEGFFQLGEIYDEKAGQWCCRAGCGYIVSNDSKG